MVVQIATGDLFKSKAQTLVNTVNCVGVMGAGVALAFRRQFPDMYEDYVRRCKLGAVKLGQPYLFRRPTTPWILNFPTKDHWRSVARVTDIVRGLEYLEKHYQEWGITSLAVPPLGCGQGQLEWKAVGRVLTEHLGRLAIPVEIYAPFGTPEEELQPSFLAERPVSTGPKSGAGYVRMEPGWVALVDILARVEAERFHWPIGRTGFQKIAYFATVTGIPTKLRYTRGSFGPYAPELKAIVTRLVNHALIDEERLGRIFAVRVGATFKDARDAYRGELDEWVATSERVADLFMRMRTDQAEAAATVHFTAAELSLTKDAKPTELDVLDEVMKWKQRRRPPFDAAQVAMTIRSLAMLGWLDVRPSTDLPVSEVELCGV